MRNLIYLITVDGHTYHVDFSNSLDPFIYRDVRAITRDTRCLSVSSIQDYSKLEAQGYNLCFNDWNRYSVGYTKALEKLNKIKMFI